MKRALLLASLALVASIALAGDKGGTYEVRVTQEGGSVLSGKLTFKKDAVEVATSGGSKKVPFRLVKEIEEVDLDAPNENERARDRLAFEEKIRGIEKKPADDDKGRGRQCSSLGDWARKKGLAEEARRAYEKAVELYPDEETARRFLGQARDADGSWQPAGAIFAKKRGALPATAEPNALYDLARWANKQGLVDEALSVIDPLADKDAFNKPLLSFLRPITDGCAQVTTLGLPLRGVWRASPDPSRHHEAKTYAVYAIDFYCEKDGKAWKGDGKKLEDHYAWDQPVYAVADGIVNGVWNDYPDNEINKLPPGDLQMKNNNVCIQHTPTELSWYIHMKKGSAKVKVGDRVKKGDVIATVGNSGASAQPHLHYTLVRRTGKTSVSVPWKLDGWNLLTDDGSKIHMKRARVLEGQLCEFPE
jgi:murein DD-endopeptidase MepM/ murein hydrolase activator NlpD